MKRSFVAVVGLLVGFLEAGCLVQITRVSDPSPVFRQARREADRLTGRPGPAHELNVLVFDPEDRQLVRVALPMWMVRRLHRHVDLEGDLDWDGSNLPGGARRAFKRHLRSQDLKLEDIEKVGLGLLAEVDETDGTQVLVWLR